MEQQKKQASKQQVSVEQLMMARLHVQGPALLAEWDGLKSSRKK
jgi:hypothetical protein